MSERKRLSSPQAGLSRRRFMQGMGLTLAAPLLTAWAPRMELVAANRSASKPLRLGVMLPSSRVYPQLGDNLLAGLILGAGREGRAIELAREDLGVEPGMALSAARRLAEKERVDALLGVIHPEIASRLAPLLAEKRIPLWVCEAGASAVNTVSPWIIYHTLHYWQAQWLLGDWAARNLGKKAAVAVSLYDSGYDALYAFRLGFEAAGGEIVQTCVTHLDPRDDGLAAAMTDIVRVRPDFTYGLYCGQAAADFVAAYGRAGLAGKIPLAGSAFMAADDLLPIHGEAALGAISCSPWANDAGNAAYAAFEEVYRARMGRGADLFAALGYDTGRLIAQTTGRGADTLAHVAFAGPRGHLTVDTATRQTRAPLYVREARWVGGALRNVTIAELELPTDLDARLKAARSSPLSGWLNTYLCA